MKHNFLFHYNQNIQTSHPFVEVDVTFLVESTIDDTDESVEIIEVDVRTGVGQFKTQFTKIEMPDERTFEGAKFWGLIREQARTQFYHHTKKLKA